MKVLLQTIFISITSFLLSIYELILQCLKDNKYKVPIESVENKWTTPILEKFRSEYDVVAQECYNILKKENGGHIPQELDILEEVIKRAKQEGEENQIFKRLNDEIYTIPPWVDFERIERGKNLVVRSSFPAGILVLTGSSLVQSYAGANGTEVLIETGRLKDDVVKRIMETGYFLQTVITPESLMPGREGHKVVLQVRMLHCAVRSYLTTRPKAWDKKKLGEPINHEDLAGTLCLFDFVFAECKTKLGYTFTQEEKEDLHLLWRYIGYLLGVDEEVLPKTYQESTDLAFAIFRHQCTPNENSQLLVKQLFDSINLSPFFLFLPNPFWNQLSRYLLGDETSNKLGINPYSEGWFLLVRFFMVIIRTQYFLHNSIPYLVEFEAAIKRPMWGLFMKMGLKGRSVDYKIKRY